MVTRVPPDSPRARQRGAALLIALLIIGLGLASLLTLRGKHRGMQMEMENKTAQSLAHAKAILLGRAVSDNDPGTFSCPGVMTDGAAGSAGCAAALAPSSIPKYAGYFPWKKFSAGDLFDGSGERLWYVLSPNFEDRGNPLLPSRPGTISVNGGPPNVVAVIIAPGIAVNGQSRAGGNTTIMNNYVESYVNETTINTTQNSSNDQIITITAGEVMNLVTQRAARDFAKSVSIYAASDKDGSYPPSNWLPTGLSDWESNFSNWNNSAVTRFTLDSANPNKGTLEFLPCAGHFLIQRVDSKDLVTGGVTC